MRAAVFKGTGLPLAIEEKPMPHAARGQAVIRVERCGICGSDLHMTTGSEGLGHEFAGEVVEVGPSCSLRLGDRVTALPLAACGACEVCRADRPLQCSQLQLMAGGFAEYALIDERFAFRLPGSLSFSDGALVEPMASSLSGIRRLRFEDKPKVAVIGVGAIGASAIYWAHRRGAAAVVAVARTGGSANLARTMGAKSFVMAGEDLVGRVEAALDGPADIVIEAAGAVGCVQQAIELVRVGGVVLSLGACVEPDRFSPLLATSKGLTIEFSAAYGRRDFEMCLEALEGAPEGPRTMVGRTISLDELPAAFEAMRSGSHPAKTMVAPHGL